jgi:hypothetical protein
VGKRSQRCLASAGRHHAMGNFRRIYLEMLRLAATWQLHANRGFILADLGVLIFFW